MPGQTKLIAEIADNHGGDMKLAKHLIRTLAGIGVDIIKFQSWQMSRVRDPKEEPFYDWLVQAELSDEQHFELVEECKENGVQFLTTCFDVNRVGFLSSLGIPSIKVPSPELSNHDMLRALTENFGHLIVSTGMHTPKEVEEAVQVLASAHYTLLHCVSIYPTTLEQANLSRMTWLKQFASSVGLSDHSDSLDTAKMAMVLDAEYIERHTAISRFGPGRVNAWDTYPERWEELVKYREMVQKAWGPGSEQPLSDTELAARKRFIGRWTGGN